MRSKLTHALGTGAEFALALWRTMKRRRLATITVLVCVLFVLGGEPRKAAALVRKYHAVLWDKTTAGRLYDYFTAGAGTPPQEPSTNRKRGGRNKVVVQPLPPGGFPNAKAIPTGGGDTQATATCIGALPYMDTGTTVGATNDYDLPADTTNPTMTGSCATIFAGAGPAGSLPHGAVYTGTGTAPDVVYAMSFPTGNPDTLTITVDPTGADDLCVVVYCNNVSSNPADAIVIDDTGVGGGAEQVTVGNIAAGTTLYIVVDGYSAGATPPGPSGPYTLSVVTNGMTQPGGVCGAPATSSDLAITKTDGVTTVSPGGSTTYTITASNAGPDPVTGGTVTDTFPAALTCNWTCVGAGGGTCTAAGSGNINDSVNLPAGGSVTYTASCSISPSATGMLSNMAMVSGGTDPNLDNNSATDTDTLTAIADLAITKTNGTSSVVASNTTTYAITASNAGPSNAPSVMVTDTFPPMLTGATWTCVGAGGGTCTAAGSGNINEMVNLPAGGSVTFFATVTVSGGALGTVSNTATVSPLGGVMDLVPGNNSATDTDTVTCPVVTLAPASLPTGEVGTAYNQTIVASPAGGSYSYTVTNGLLPPGLTLDASTGAISGTPSQTGNFNFRVTANGFGGCTAFLDYLIAITTCAPITVSPASLPGGTVGTAYSEAVSAAPAGAYAFTVTNGVLPPGLSLNAATGVISGSPNTSGSFNFRVTAALEGCSGSREYTVAIACPTLTLDPATLSPGQAGVAYSQTISPTPAGSYTFSLAVGTLPSGLTLNPATGVISGVPSSTGTATFTVQALGAGGCSTTQSYTLAIGCPPVAINPATLPSGTAGTAYSQTITASPAGGNYTFAVTSGGLPAGLNLNSSTGVLSGTPTVNGSFAFTVTATGFGGCPGSQSYTVVIGSGGCPTVTLPASLPGGSVGALYNNAVAASPSGIYSYGVTAGSLPPGVTLFGSNGLIFGYPTAAGTYSFTITATQGACSGSQAYTVTIGAGFASSLTVFSDFDGDGKSDLSVFRGSDGNWLVANSGDGQLNSTPWGASYEPYNDVPVSGDYDGDGLTDLAVFRRGGEHAGYWFIKRSSDGQVSSHFWGLPTDIPVPGDYDGDGKTDVAVWRGSVGGWYIVRSSDGGVEGFHWGAASAGDIPAPGDYDGNLKTDFAVFRRSGINSRGDGHWYVRRSSDGSTMDVEWGVGTDVPVPGDYDADGKTDLAVWRAADGNWYIIESSSAAVRTVTLGAKGDVQAPGDYDGDGKADAAVWRASTGVWTVKRSSDGGEVSTTLGQSGDVPVVARRN